MPERWRRAARLILGDRMENAFSRNLGVRRLSSRNVRVTERYSAQLRGLGGDRSTRPGNDPRPLARLEVAHPAPPAAAPPFLERGVAPVPRLGSRPSRHQAFEGPPVLLRPSRTPPGDDAHPSCRGLLGQSTALGGQYDIDLAAVAAGTSAYQTSRLEQDDEPHRAGVTQAEHVRQPPDVWPSRNSASETNAAAPVADSPVDSSTAAMPSSTKPSDERGEQVAQPRMRLLPGHPPLGESIDDRPRVGTNV